MLNIPRGSVGEISTLATLFEIGSHTTTAVILLGGLQQAPMADLAVRFVWLLKFDCALWRESLEVLAGEI